MISFLTGLIQNNKSLYLAMAASFVNRAISLFGPHLVTCRRIPLLLLVLIGVFSLAACTQGRNIPTKRPLPSTVPKLTDLIASEMNEYPPPVDAIEALGKFGPEAAPAIGVITPWLEYKADRGYTNSIAAETLARIGPDAASAVPALVDAILWLKGTESLELGTTLASLTVTLGHIGPDASGAVPNLVGLLYSENPDIRFVAAWSIAQIVKADWPDAELSLDYDKGIVIFSDERKARRDVDEDYLIVKSAREWWEQEGRKREWPSLK